MPTETPDRVGRFEIRRELGRGMMGVVYEALDPGLARRVALKVIRLAFATSKKERETFERRFMTEARAAANLSHPGIVVVHEVGRDPESGLLYLAFEYLEGRVLSALLAERGRLEEKEALRLVGQVARALDYAHARGVVHRDIKPANIMVLPDGRPKILDFGLAKLEAGHDLTAPGQFLGTPQFMSPEQALGEAVDGRSDLFSLGAILYTLLSGRRPFEADTVGRLLARVAHQPPTPLRQVAPSVSAEAESVVARALVKDPARRYPTGAAMAEDIEDVLAGRRPRHGAEASVVGAETVVRDASSGGELPELHLEPVSPRPRRRPFPLRALVLTFLLGGLAHYYVSISGPERLAAVIALFVTPPPAKPARPPTTLPAPSTPSSPTASEFSAPPSSPSAPSSPAPLNPPPSEEGAVSEGAERVQPIVLPDAEEAPAEGEDVPADKPETAAPPLARSPTPEPRVRAPATLAIHLEHPLTRGTVKVWLDGKLVLREALSSTVTKKILFFTFRSGRVRETLKVAPGLHKLRVEVRGQDRSDSAQDSVLFKSGSKRRLFVRASSRRGRLSFEWR
jgi:serine/threonine-protein kinase